MAIQMNNDAIDGGKIFIWAQVGEMLKQLDEKRILCIAQQNANYSLSVMANDEILKHVSLMKKTDDITDEQLDEIIRILTDTNYRDNLFREITKFLQREPHDLLSIGSFITGEIESKTAFLDLSHRNGEI